MACGLHKPNRQTILPAAAVPDLFLTLPVKKVRHLGGKLGDTIMESLKCNVMSDLLRFSLQYLQNRFDEKNGLWLYNIARGNDNEPVTPRLVSKSIGACKKFPGKQAIDQKDVVSLEFHKFHKFLEKLFILKLYGLILWDKLNLYKKLGFQFGSAIIFV